MGFFFSLLAGAFQPGGARATHVAQNIRPNQLTVPFVEGCGNVKNFYNVNNLLCCMVEARAGGQQVREICMHNFHYGVDGLCFCAWVLGNYFFDGSFNIHQFSVS